MALWNNNDQESSKPNWLTEEQKRVCVRTNRGWEIPLAGCGYGGSTANPFNQSYVTSSYDTVVPMELIVAMPLDPSATGVTNSNYTSRGITGIVAGATSREAVNNLNYAPYFTIPADGINLYHTKGTTAYYPVIVADVNPTDFGTVLTTTPLTFGYNPTAGHISFIKDITASTINAWGNGFTAAAGVTTSTYPYGGLGGVTLGAAALLIGASLTGGTYGATAYCWDLRGLTGTTRFNIVVRG